jgi:thiamine-phosphate pyrophosphorylase
MSIPVSATGSAAVPRTGVFGLYLILTNPVAGYETCAEAAVRCGLRYLQLRMKETPDDEVLPVARRLREITRGSTTRFIVNDSVTLAAEADADGVHLGQGDMGINEARAFWKEEGRIYGLSTHNPEQARQAAALEPDYIGVGPVFATTSKVVPDPVLGLEAMGEMIRQSPVTTVALGGIFEEQLTEVLAHGAVNFAVVRAVNQADDPEPLIRRLMEIWQAHQDFPV